MPYHINTVVKSVTIFVAQKADAYVYTQLSSSTWNQHKTSS